MAGVDDRYTIPGSGGVLRNKLGITDAHELDEAMNDFASLEWAVLLQQPIPDTLDFTYLAQIHRRMFHDVLGDDEVGD